MPVLCVAQHSVFKAAVYRVRRQPVALDLSGDLTRAYALAGTPYTLALAAGGEVLRSVYGSQNNAQMRLEYLLAEPTGEC